MDSSRKAERLTRLSPEKAPSTGVSAIPAGHRAMVLASVDPPQRPGRSHFDRDLPPFRNWSASSNFQSDAALSNPLILPSKEVQ